MAKDVTDEDRARDAQLQEDAKRRAAVQADEMAEKRKAGANARARRLLDDRAERASRKSAIAAIWRSPSEIVREMRDGIDG